VFGRCRKRWEDTGKMSFQYIGWEGMDRTNVALEPAIVSQWQVLLKPVTNFQVSSNAESF
jgi:hypothetical protein